MDSKGLSGEPERKNGCVFDTKPNRYTLVAQIRYES
jgi:hypothetical protein